MSDRNLPRASPGRPIPASLLSALNGASEASSRLRAAAGMPLASGPDGPHPRAIATRRFAARLVGTASPYGIVEVYDRDDGTFADLPGGRACTGCAYELRGLAGLDGKIAVGVRPSDAGDYRFSWRRGDPPGCISVANNLCVHAGQAPAGSTVSITVTDSSGSAAGTASGAIGSYCFTVDPDTYTVVVATTTPDGHVCNWTGTAVVTTTCEVTDVDVPCCWPSVVVCVLACSGFPNPGSVITLATDTGDWSDTQTAGADGCATFHFPSARGYRVSAVSGLPRLAVTPVDVTLACGYPTGGITLASVPTGDFLCCVACPVPVARTLTCVSKYGTCTLTYLHGFGLTWAGEITFSEPDCALWSLCANASGDTPYCTWLNYPTSGTCTARFQLSCGATDSYGVPRWYLQVYRHYCWALDEPCPTVTGGGSTIDYSSGKCMPFPDNAGTFCGGWLGIEPGYAPPGANAGWNAVAKAFADTTDPSCYPTDLTFAIGDGSGLMNGGSFYPTVGPRPIGITVIGPGACAALTEFDDTVHIFDPAA